MAWKGKMVSLSDVIGGTIVDVSTWGGITVQTEDGREVEIRAEEGHSGTELNAYE